MKLNVEIYGKNENELVKFLSKVIADISAGMKEEDCIGTDTDGEDLPEDELEDDTIKGYRFDIDSSNNGDN